MGQVIGAGTLSQGQRIPISLELESGSTNKFVKCTVLGPDNQILFGGPFSVPHVFGGSYRRNDKEMPNLESIYVKFEVFDDAGWSNPSANDGNSADIFTLDKGRITSGAEVDGFVEDDELTIAVELEENTSSVDNEETTGGLFDEDLTGNLDDGEVTGAVEEDETQTETGC